MRSAPARACWPTAISTANIRTGATSCTMYDENARNVPSVRCPLSASQPPNASTATWAEHRDGLQHRRVPRLQLDEPDARPEQVLAGIGEMPELASSCPKPFTTRTPVTASSTTPATSPARCCASQLAGKIVVRNRSVTNSSAGSASSATSVSGGDRTTITTSATTRNTRLPSMIGRNISSPCSRPTSLLARDTSWPVCIWSCDREVEALQPLVHRVAQVVLHVEAHPPADVAAHERGDEAEHAGGDQQREPRRQRPAVVDDDVVDDDLLGHGRERGHRLAEDRHAERDEHVALVRHEERQQAAAANRPRKAAPAPASADPRRTSAARMVVLPIGVAERVQSVDHP